MFRPLSSFLLSLRRHPHLTIGRVITAGGLRSLLIFVLPAAFTLLLCGILVWVLASLDCISLVENTNTKHASLWANLRGMLFLFLDPGYLYYNMDQSALVEIFALMMSLLGMLLINGLLVSTIVNYISRQGDHVLKGQVSYASIKQHAVMIGYSEMGISILQEMLKAGDKAQHVLVMTHKDVETLRPRVYAQLDAGEEKRVIFYSGDYESQEDLARLNIPFANTLYITGEEHSEGRDSKNIECLHQIVALLEQHPATASAALSMNIYVQYDRLSSSAIAQKLNFKKIIIDPVQKLHPQSRISIHAFNFYENWARLLWSGQSRWHIFFFY